MYKVWTGTWKSIMTDFSWFTLQPDNSPNYFNISCKVDNDLMGSCKKKSTSSADNDSLCSTDASWIPCTTLCLTTQTITSITWLNNDGERGHHCQTPLFNLICCELHRSKNIDVTVLKRSSLSRRENMGQNFLQDQLKKKKKAPFNSIESFFCIYKIKYSQPPFIILYWYIFHKLCLVILYIIW